MNEKGNPLCAGSSNRLDRCRYGFIEQKAQADLPMPARRRLRRCKDYKLARVGEYQLSRRNLGERCKTVLYGGVEMFKQRIIG